MKKYEYLLRLTCIGILFCMLFSCNNEDEFSGNVIVGLNVNVDFVKLVDNGSNIAGELSIISEFPDIQLIWNTDSICNLDTSLTSLSSQDGKFILPIKWDKILPEGTMGPKGVAYKAGVKIVAKDYSKYVPLIWSERIDSAKVMKSISLTRSANDTLPRVLIIAMTPTTVHMSYANGGAMYIDLHDVPYAILDVSNFLPNMNIDISKIPTSITESQLMEFKWNSKGAPLSSFSTHIIAIAEGLTQTGVISYEAPIIDSYIEVAGIKWAPGNLRFDGTTYYFDSSQISAGDYFGWNWYTTATNVYNYTFEYDSEKDPCDKVAPKGTWKTPSKSDFESLINAGYRVTTSPVNGCWFGEQVFCAGGGYRKDYGSFYLKGISGQYWTSTTSTPYKCSYVMSFGEAREKPGISDHWCSYGLNVRCVKR